MENRLEISTAQSGAVTVLTHLVDPDGPYPSPYDAPPQVHRLSPRGLVRPLDDRDYDAAWDGPALDIATEHGTITVNPVTGFVDVPISSLLASDETVLVEFDVLAVTALINSPDAIDHIRAVTDPLETNDATPRPLHLVIEISGENEAPTPSPVNTVTVIVDPDVS